MDAIVCYSMSLIILCDCVCVCARPVPMCGCITILVHVLLWLYNLSKVQTLYSMLLSEN